MIDINRNNYEEYFLDFLEGNLSASEKELLMSFLNDNPDLKEELEILEEIPELQSEKSFLEKTALKKFSENNASDNFDELCIARIEGDLNAKEIAEFDAFINENKKRKKDFELYKLTKIEVDTNIIFHGKNALKKGSAAIFFFRNRYAVMSAAASIIVALAVFTFTNKTNLDENIVKQQMAEVKNESVVKQTEKVVPNTNTPKIKNIKGKRIDIQVAPVNAEIKAVVVDSSIEPTVKQEYFQLAKLSIKEIGFDYEPVTNEIAPIEILEYEFEQKAPETDNRHISLKKLIAGVINKEIFNRSRNDKIEMFDVAQASLKGINKITGSNMELTRIYKENGELDKTEFNSKLIAFSTPAKNN